MIELLTETRLNPRFPLSRSELRPLLQDILSVLGLQHSSLTLRLVGDGEIARLNQEFMGCTGPTNVLSFPARDEWEGGAAEDALSDMGPDIQDALSIMRKSGLDESEDGEEAFRSLRLVLPGELLGHAACSEGESEAKPAEVAEPDRSYLGEIALSVDSLARETRLYGQEPREHLVRLLAHAVLHLSGLDHGPEMDAAMQTVTDSLTD